MQEGPSGYEPPEAKIIINGEKHAAPKEGKKVIVKNATTKGGNLTVEMSGITGADVEVAGGTVYRSAYETQSRPVFTLPEGIVLPPERDFDSGYINALCRNLTISAQVGRQGIREAMKASLRNSFKSLTTDEALNSAFDSIKQSYEANSEKLGWPKWDELP